MFENIQQDIMDSFKCYVLIMSRAFPDASIPNVHLGMHLLHRLSLQGSGRNYSNWLDESLNKTLKAACRNASQMTFEVTVLTSMQYKLREQSARSSSSALGQ